MRTLAGLILIFAVAGCGGEPSQNGTSIDLSTHSAWILDDRSREAVVQAFDSRGVPYEIRNVSGEQNIVWPKQYDSEVSDIGINLFGRRPPQGRYISFLDTSNYDRLQKDLERLGIESHMYQHTGPYGNLEYVYWDEKDTPEVTKLIESYGFKVYSEEELGALKNSSDVSQ